MRIFSKNSLFDGTFSQVQCFLQRCFHPKDECLEGSATGLKETGADISI